MLRNGEKVVTRDVADLTKGQLVHLMLGKEMEPDYRAAVPEEASTDVVLEVKALAGRYLRDTSFALHRGEVLGIAGLPDSGRDELPRILTDRASTPSAARSGRPPSRGWTSGCVEGVHRGAPPARPGPRGRGRAR